LIYLENVTSNANLIYHINSIIRLVNYEIVQVCAKPAQTSINNSQKVNKIKLALSIQNICHSH